MKATRILLLPVLVLAGWGPSTASAAETGFLDRVVVVDEVDYQYQVYVPRNYEDSISWPVILTLHGTGVRGTDGIRQTQSGLGTALRRYPDRYPAIVVFPQSPIEGPGWQELGGRVALAALDQTLSEFSADAARVYLTGYSQGGNGTWYLAYHHPQRFAAAVAVCGFVQERVGVATGDLYPAIAPSSSPDPFGEVARRVSQLPIWIFHGDADQTISVEQSRGMASALQALGADVKYTEFPGVGHNAWDLAYGLEALSDWLFEQRLP